MYVFVNTLHIGDIIIIIIIIIITIIIQLLVLKHTLAFTGLPVSVCSKA